MNFHYFVQNILYCHWSLFTFPFKIGSPSLLSVKKSYESAPKYFLTILTIIFYFYFCPRRFKLVALKTCLVFKTLLIFYKSSLPMFFLLFCRRERTAFKKRKDRRNKQEKFTGAQVIISFYNYMVKYLGGVVSQIQVCWTGVIEMAQDMEMTNPQTAYLMVAWVDPSQEGLVFRVKGEGEASFLLPWYPYRKIYVELP